MGYRASIAAVYLCLVAPATAGAELVVVVNPDSGVSEISRSELVNIYMGRFQALPSGITAFPVDLAPRKAEFYQALVSRTLAEINSYWARLVFSGKASPPRTVSTARDVLDVVANNRGAIGYVERSEVDTQGVRIVMQLDQQPQERD